MPTYCLLDGSRVCPGDNWPSHFPSRNEGSRVRWISREMVSVVLYPSCFIMNACTGQASKKSIVADGYMIKRRVKQGALVQCHEWLRQHLLGNVPSFSCAVRQSSSMDATSIWYIPLFSPLLWTSTHESTPWLFLFLGSQTLLGISTTSWKTLI